METEKHITSFLTFEEVDKVAIKIVDALVTRPRQEGDYSMIKDLDIMRDIVVCELLKLKFTS